MRTVHEYNRVQYTLDNERDTTIAHVLNERPGLDNPVVARMPRKIIRRRVTEEVMHGVVHNAVANAIANLT